jgi:hypothetical protein
MMTSALIQATTHHKMDGIPHRVIPRSGTRAKVIIG